MFNSSQFNIKTGDVVIENGVARLFYKSFVRIPSQSLRGKMGIFWVETGRINREDTRKLCLYVKRSEAVELKKG